MKTLEEAIGCWTTKREYGCLDERVNLVVSSARKCRALTMRGDPALLLNEIQLLRRRLGAMDEIAAAAERRCQEIIDTDELRKG